MKVKIKKAVLIAALVASVTVLSGCGANWERQKKNWDSEFLGGLNREIIVYSATGAEVWRFIGKFDVDFSEGRILFDDENPFPAKEWRFTKYRQESLKNKLTNPIDRSTNQRQNNHQR